MILKANLRDAFKIEGAHFSRLQACKYYFDIHIFINRYTAVANNELIIVLL